MRLQTLVPLAPLGNEALLSLPPYGKEEACVYMQGKDGGCPLLLVSAGHKTQPHQTPPKKVLGRAFLQGGLLRGTGVPTKRKTILVRTPEATLD